MLLIYWEGSTFQGIAIAKRMVLKPGSGSLSTRTVLSKYRIRKANCSASSARGQSTKSAAIAAAAVEFGQQDDITVVTIHYLAAGELSSLRTERLPAPV
jgi:hypothetical protein